MRPTTWSLLVNLVLVSSAWGAVFPSSSWKDVQQIPGNAVPNKFIVEVDNTKDIPGKRELHSREVHPFNPYSAHLPDINGT